MAPVSRTDGDEEAGYPSSSPLPAHRKFPGVHWDDGEDPSGLPVEEFLRESTMMARGDVSCRGGTAAIEALIGRGERVLHDPATGLYYTTRDLAEVLKHARRLLSGAREAAHPRTVPREVDLLDRLSALTRGQFAVLFERLKLDAGYFLPDNNEPTTRAVQLLQYWRGQRRSEVELASVIAGLTTPKPTTPPPARGEAPTMPTTRKLLFLGASPSNQVRLALREEESKIRSSLHAAREGGAFQVAREWAVNAADLQRVLFEHGLGPTRPPTAPPTILHFSGHGGSDGALMFENDQGEAQPVPPAVLGRLFKILGGGIEGVVLNACFSAAQAEILREHVGWVIGMKQSIPDRAAIAFASSFYLSLGQGLTIEDAFALGCNQIEMEGVSGANVPVLLRRGGMAVIAVDDPRASQRALPPVGPAAKKGVRGAARKLDRTPQWGGIAEALREHPKRDLYFLLHGEEAQALQFFCGRVRHHLDEIHDGHRLIDLRYEVEHSSPTTVEVWEGRLRSALAESLGVRQGAATALLEQVLKAESLFLLIELRYHDDFKDTHREAIRSFLVNRLPDLLPRGKRRPLRLLVAVDYLARGRSAAHVVDGILREAETAGVATFEPLPEVCFPPWGEVEAYVLKHKKSRRSLTREDPIFLSIKRQYDAMARAKSFRALVEMLDEKLAECDP